MRRPQSVQCVVDTGDLNWIFAAEVLDGPCGAASSQPGVWLPTLTEHWGCGAGPGSGRSPWKGERQAPPS